MIFQNVNDPTGVSGNNLQVKAALTGSPSNADIDMQQGANTDVNGKILIGTLKIYSGVGATTFTVEPLASTNFTNPASSTFNTLSNQTSGAPGTAVNATTPLSGANPTAGVSTVLAANMFGSTPINLDQSYNSNTRPSSASYNTFVSLASMTATAGPNAVPPSSSMLPFYTASTPPFFAFTVTAVPEPGSLMLCGLLAVTGAGLETRRRAKKRRPI